jgi:uncharacterized RDD family membrane protein YckC
MGKRRKQSKKVEKSLAEELHLPEATSTDKARWWKRLLALAVDLLMLWLISQLVMSFLPISRELTAQVGASPTWDAMSKLADTNPQFMRVMTLVFFCVSLVYLVYFTLMQFVFGQTLGMRLNDIVVTEVPGKKRHIWRYLVRNLWIIMWPLSLLVWIVDLMFFAFDANGQRLLEKLSGTIVKEKKKV